MASKLKADKKTVFVAVVEVTDELSHGSDTNQGSISFYTSPDMGYASELFKLQFQRNHLKPSDTLGHVDRDQPPSEYDFGSYAYGRFYGGHIVLTHDTRASDMGVKQLQTISKVMKKLLDTIREYNLDRVTGDEMMQFQLAAEKLGVEVRMRRWSGNKRIEDIFELPQERRHPAQDLLESIRERGQNGEAVH